MCAMCTMCVPPPAPPNLASASRHLNHLPESTYRQLAPAGRPPDKSGKFRQTAANVGKLRQTAANPGKRSQTPANGGEPPVPAPNARDAYPPALARFRSGQLCPTKPGRRWKARPHTSVGMRPKFAGMRSTRAVRPIHRHQVGSTPNSQPSSPFALNPAFVLIRVHPWLPSRSTQPHPISRFREFQIEIKAIFKERNSLPGGRDRSDPWCRLSARRPARPKTQDTLFLIAPLSSA